MPPLADPPRVIRPDEADLATDLLVQAFFLDPLWGWAFPDPDARREQHRQLWGLAVLGALRYPWTWLTAGDTACALWIPPGGTELTPEQELTFRALLDAWPAETADRARAGFDALDEHHPHDVPHYYLSLLGTGDTHRGHGYGLGLLGATLERIDAEGSPAYLEASNLANVSLYERYGFAVRDRFAVRDGPEVATMWRDPRPLTGEGSS